MKDGTMTSDNETVNEDGDEDILDIPMRTKKISSRYSSKRAKQFGLLNGVDPNESGYSTTSMAGANRNENESDDDNRSFSTHGLYTG